MSQGLWGLRGKCCGVPGVFPYMLFVGNKSDIADMGGLISKALMKQLIGNKTGSNTLSPRH